jgi:hypothetical protein
MLACNCPIIPANTPLMSSGSQVRETYRPRRFNLLIAVFAVELALTHRVCKEEYVNQNWKVHIEIQFSVYKFNSLIYK